MVFLTVYYTEYTAAGITPGEVYTPYNRDGPMLSLSMVSKVTATGFPFGVGPYEISISPQKNYPNRAFYQGSYDRPWRIIFFSRLGHPDAPEHHGLEPTSKE